MPKMKTHSGAKKRFKLTAKGKVRGRHAFSSHILEKKSPKRKRALRPAGREISEPRRAAGQEAAGSGQVTRVKRSVHARKKRRATLELTKGFRGEAHSHYKRAKEAVHQGRPLRATATGATASATSAACGSRASTPPRARTA